MWEKESGKKEKAEQGRGKQSLAPKSNIKVTLCLSSESDD